MLDKPVIIDIVGSHSTGKTTCIQHIKTLLDLLDFSYEEIASTSRTEADNMFSKDNLYKGVNDFLQAWISMTNWANILTSVQQNDFTLCTDLGVRSMAYAMSSPEVNSKTVFAHKKIVDYFNSPLFLSAVAVYRIYLPIEFDIVEDGVRIKDMEFSKKFDENLRYIFNSCHIPYIEMTGTIQQRNSQLRDLITRITTANCAVKYDPNTLKLTPVCYEDDK